MRFRLFVPVLLLFAALTTPTKSQDTEERRWLVMGIPDPAIIEAADGTGYYISLQIRPIAWKDGWCKKIEISLRQFSPGVASYM
jgi:hypothetical protein